jgi:ABC-2 type transport system permease protein/sodium transport system permease protein
VAAVVVVLTTLLYALAALALAARLFGAEAVLYSQASTWADLFRRPRTPRDAPQASGALLCLALMFPAYFLIVYGQAHLGQPPISVALFLSMLGNAVLFITLPGLSLWLGRVRPGPGLALAWPGVQACVAAVILGLSLWPLVHELALALRAAGLSNVNEEYLAKLTESLERWRQTSPLLVFLALAVVAPVLEELFFRGYLYGALAKELRPGPTIAATAALFGAFHLFLPFGMTFDRLLTTALLGGVLGWVRWRSGSVWPGTLLHVAHNGAVAMLAYYQPELEKAGWTMAGDQHLPGHWVAASLTAVALGVAWLTWATVPPREGAVEQA